MAGGGGNNQMLDMGLMIAAGVAAPELAPVIFGEGGAAAGLGLGATSATALTGAGLSGLTAAATGQDVGKAAAMGALGGAASGAFGGVNMGNSVANAGTGFAGGAGSSLTNGAGTFGGTITNPDLITATGSAAPITGLESTTPNLIPSAGGFNSKAAMIGGGIAGLNSLLGAPQPGMNAQANLPPYTGALSHYKFNPYTYQPVQSPSFGYGPVQAAEGGIMKLAMGGMPGQMYPQSQQDHTVFADPTQLPASAMAVRNFEPATNPMTGDMTKPMASGGIASLGSYSDGGQLLRGPGDGMSDNIPARIGQHQPARLADGEFVVPADVVSHLGNGSTDAGAKHLYSMMNKVRKARTGNPKQGKQINPSKYLPA